MPASLAVAIRACPQPCIWPSAAIRPCCWRPSASAGVPRGAMAGSSIPACARGRANSIALFGRDGARALFDLAEEAKALVRERVVRHGIACDLKSGSLYVAYKRDDPEWMAAEVDILRNEFGYDTARLLSKAELEERLGSRRYFGAVADTAAGHLHPLNYALGLAAAAEAAGVRICEGSAATLAFAGRGAHGCGPCCGAPYPAGLQRLSRRARAAHCRPHHADLQLHHRHRTPWR